MQVHQRRRGLKTKSAKIGEQEGHGVQSRAQAPGRTKVTGKKEHELFLRTYPATRNRAATKRFYNQDRALHISARQADAPPAFILG